MIALAQQSNIIDEVIHGEALAVLRTLPDNSVDAIVCDPPAGISFMNKTFDSDRGGRDFWIAWLHKIMAEALRVLKPGGHAFVWSLPRTSHWTGMALEDAGFEIRDVVTHITGSGFPKSADISKAIDKMQGAEREVVGNYGRSFRPHKDNGNEGWLRPSHEVHGDITAPATPEASQWNGWGTALKPASEHWWLCRKPLSEPTIAANVLKWGTGAINVDKCRVSHDEPLKPMKAQVHVNSIIQQSGRYEATTELKENGRWPANLLLSHSVWCVPNGVKKVKGNGGVRPDKPIHHNGSKRIYGTDQSGIITSAYNDSEGMEQVEDWLCDESCPVRLLDEQSGNRVSKWGKSSKSGSEGFFNGGTRENDRYQGDQGGASRYFQRFYPFIYQAKASRSERNSGLLLDSSEIVMIELSHNSQAGGIEWEKQDQRVRLQVDTAQSHPRVIGVSGTTMNDVQEWNTFLFGNDTTEPFLKECKFTIVTKTSSITASKTLNWLIRSLTSGSIVDVNSEMVNGGSHAAIVETGIPSVTIISDQTVSLPGVGHVAAQTQLRISVSEKPEHNNIDFGTMKVGGSGKPVPFTGLPLPRANVHPCVKPVQLLRYLICMITPPGGIVLDCFAGSGSTLVAAIHEGMHFIGIEMNDSEQEPYISIARARIEQAFREVQ